VRFVETPIFTKDVGDLPSDDEHREMQQALALRPEQGPLIRGSGGLRKLRWRLRGGGKRGGARVIYYWYIPDELLYMLYIYPKNAQEELTAAQLRTLARRVRKEFK
jgi:hypothetical protein